MFKGKKLQIASQVFKGHLNTLNIFRKCLEVFRKSLEFFGSRWNIFGNPGNEETKISCIFDSEIVDRYTLIWRGWLYHPFYFLIKNASHILVARWRIVVHGDVDGYTRIPVYLHAGTNNRAETVTELFTRAIEEYGLPPRVRSDKGGENVGVSMYMLEHPLCGPGRGSMIVGRSVHNPRIERLWRDVYMRVSSTFITIFSTTWRSV